MTHTLHVPWFYVSFTQIAQEEDRLAQMLMLSELRQLQRLAQDSTVAVLEVNVVIPGHMAPDRKWLMTPLAAVWEGKIRGEDVIDQVYVAADGRRFSGYANVTHEDELDGRRLVYRTLVVSTYR
ncbi:MAG: hypothetical protein HGA75_01930 [Thiobacillus sp.]|nr:hypothetical protein [Thiobacillus sp.]